MHRMEEEIKVLELENVFLKEMKTAFSDHLQAVNIYINCTILFCFTGKNDKQKIY